MPTAPDHSTRQFRIDGRELSYPTDFRDGSSCMGLFLVDADRADELILESGFKVARVSPGKGLLSLICVHYTDSDCGSYEEIALAFFVDKEGGGWRVPFLGNWYDLLRSGVASYTWRLPVTTVLSRDAGIEMWGFPKTLETIEYQCLDRRASFCWRSGEEVVLRFSVPASGRRQPDTFTSPVYSVFEGEHHVSYLTQSYRDTGYHLFGGVEIQLGAHPVADELRGLGLPRRPLAAAWNGHVAFKMSAPERLYDW